jgi:hypothetical protein
MWDMTQCLLTLHKALGSIPSTVSILAPGIK